jgi:hypothetical protein
MTEYFFDIPLIGKYVEQVVATREVGVYLTCDLLRRQTLTPLANEVHDPEDPTHTFELGIDPRLTLRQRRSMILLVARLMSITL